ncbi:MAG TPA: tetratricopeptide repeat protein [Candidatus Obscuribacterales bacterium]
MPGSPAVAASPEHSGAPVAAARGEQIAARLAPPLPAVTQEALWKKYNEYGMTAYQRGSLPEAARMFRSAYKLAANFGRSDLRLAAVATNLGAVYRDMGKHSAAEQLLKQALDIKKKHLPPTDPSLLLTQKHYSELLRKTHRETEARLLAGRTDLIASSGRAITGTTQDRGGVSPEVGVAVPEGAGTTAASGGIPEPTFPDSKRLWEDFRRATDFGSAPPEGSMGPAHEAPPAFGNETGDFHPKRLVFRGVTSDDPDVPTWRARLAMQRREWFTQAGGPVIGNGPPGVHDQCGTESGVPANGWGSTTYWFGPGSAWGHAPAARTSRRARWGQPAGSSLGAPGTPGAGGPPACGHFPPEFAGPQPSGAASWPGTWAAGPQPGGCRRIATPMPAGRPAPMVRLGFR